MSTRTKTPVKKTTTTKTPAKTVAPPADETPQQKLDRLEAARKKGATGTGKEIADTRKLVGAGSGTTTTTDTSAADDASRAKAEKTVGEIADKAGTFGDTFANRYLPTGTFGTLAAGSTPQMLQYLDTLRQHAATAGDYTTNENASIAAQQAGLGGYTAPELNAQREQANQQIQQDLATQMRVAALHNAVSGVRGAAANAGTLGLQKASGQATANTSRDIFVKNADEIQRRKDAFSTLVNNTETARFGRQQTADTKYGNQLGGEENVQRGVQQFNIGQKENEATARSGLALAGAGTYTGLYGGQQSADLTKAYLESTTANAAKQNELLQQYYNKISNTDTSPSA